MVSSRKIYRNECLADRLFGKWKPCQIYVGILNVKLISSTAISTVLPILSLTLILLPIQYSGMKINAATVQ